MKEAFNKIDDNGEQHAYNNHRSNWKIKPGAALFYPDISRQAAQPIEFIMKEINDHTHQYSENAGEYYPFACGSVHGAKIEFGRYSMVGNHISRPVIFLLAKVQAQRK